MKDQVIQLLRDLAAQIGTTVDKLWAVMVAQANVSAVMNGLYILSVLFSAILAIIIYQKAKNVARFYTNDSKNRADARARKAGESPGYYDSNSYSPFDCLFCGDATEYSRNGLAVVWCSAIVYFGIGLIAVGVDAGSKFVTAIVNPEYWALTKILSFISR